MATGWNWKQLSVVGAAAAHGRAQEGGGAHGDMHWGAAEHN